MKPLAWRPQWKHLLLALFLAFPLLMLNGVYRPHHSDHAWSTSWAHQLVEKGSAEDEVFDPTAWGTKIFSRSSAFVYGVVLRFIGWTKFGAQTITLILGLLSLLVWYFLGKELLPQGRGVFLFLVILGWSEAFISSALLPRGDMLTFLLISLGLLLFFKERWFWAVFVLCVALENHPLGLTGFFLILPRLGTVVVTQRRLKVLLPLFGGGLLGIAFYLFLHFDYLKDLIPLLQSASGGSVFTHYLAAHFFQFLASPGNLMYYRALPFLSFLIIALGVHLFSSELRKEGSPALQMLAAGLISTFFLRRGNGEYALFLYPVFSLVIAQALIWLRPRCRGLVPLFLAGYLILHGGMYSFLIVRNREGRRFPVYIEALQSAVTDESLPVYGGFNDWFAFTHRHYRRNLLIDSEQPRTAYWLESRGTLFHGRLDQTPRPENYHFRLIQTLHPPGGGTVTVYLAEKK